MTTVHLIFTTIIPVVIIIFLFGLYVWNMAYKYGFKDGQSTQASNYTPIVQKPARGAKKGIETDEERRLKTVMANIDNYDGTTKNQTKVR